MADSKARSPQTLDNEAHRIIVNALERTDSQLSKTSTTKESSGRSSFGKSLSSMLNLSRTNTREKDPRDKDEDRGRSLFAPNRRSGSQSRSRAAAEKEEPRGSSRARSSSPNFLKRWRTREQSPAPQRLALSQSDAETSDWEGPAQPRSAFMEDDADSDDGSDDSGDDAMSDEDMFDPITEANTEANAVIVPPAADAGPGELAEDCDPVGEGVNVVVAPEPYFPTTLNSTGPSARGKRTPRRRKTMRLHEPLHLDTSRPNFKRDRCTMTITQGDPDAKAAAGAKRRRYVVASDLSEESRYALEWAIGTVLRDGDEMLVVNVVENDNKVDPATYSAGDRSSKLRNQQERQGMAYILARQVTSLLQRTRLHVTVVCQAWHAKNARHMLLDIVDYMEPVMLIVGSRGTSQINGILLGSTSHYLIEKCSVPVMVARRRLKRPPRRAAHLSSNRKQVKLSEAGIDRVAGKVDEDVSAMRDELQKEDKRRDSGERFDAPQQHEHESSDSEGDNEVPRIEVKSPVAH